MKYYKCHTPDGAVLWQEITDDGAQAVRLLDADGRPVRGAVSYAIESTDQSLWPLELLPRCRLRRHAELSAVYEAAVVRDYPSAALGATHTYPAQVVDKLYMNARVSQALVVQDNVPLWTPAAVVTTRKVVRPTVWNGWIYICSAAGITGTVEPAWPVVKGEQVRDGTAGWMAWEQWTGRFICKDGGDYVRREHSPEQIIQVGMEGAAFVQAQLDRRDTLAIAIEVAADPAALDAIGMDFP